MGNGKKGREKGCISCNQACFGIITGRSITCFVNHAVGREVEIQVGPGEKRKKIYVAVGVPAGMWFALIATLRGHDVTPYEKEDRWAT